MPENLDVPPHLKITLETKHRLRSGWNTDEALIGGLAHLENFVRTSPDDHPMIPHTLELEELPITRDLVRKCEDFAREKAGELPWGMLAVVQQGFLIRALAGLEAQSQQLASRLTVLEQR